MGIPQHALDADERVVLAVRPHTRVLVGPMIVLLVLTPVTVVVATFVSGGGVGAVLRTVVLLLGAVVVFRGAIAPYLLWRSTVYTVTTQRVAVRRGVLSRFGRDVPLDKVSGVSFRSGPWDRPFGSGRVRIDATGEGPLVLDDVPAVEQLQRTVQKYAGLATVDVVDAGHDEGVDERVDEGDDEGDDELSDDLDDDRAQALADELAEPFEPERFDGDDPGAPDDETWKRRGRRGGWRQ